MAISDTFLSLFAKFIERYQSSVNSSWKWGKDSHHQDLLIKIKDIYGLAQEQKNLFTDTAIINHISNASLMLIKSDPSFVGYWQQFLNSYSKHHSVPTLLSQGLRISNPPKGHDINSIALQVLSEQKTAHQNEIYLLQQKNKQLEKQLIESKKNPEMVKEVAKLKSQLLDMTSSLKKLEDSLGIIPISNIEPTKKEENETAPNEEKLSNTPNKAQTDTAKPTLTKTHKNQELKSKVENTNKRPLNFIDELLSKTSKKGKGLKKANQSPVSEKKSPNIFS